MDKYNKLKEKLEDYTTEELFELIPTVFSVGRTWFDDENKKYISEGHYNVLYEYYNLNLIDIPPAPETNTYYGATLREVLVKTIEGEKIV